MSYKYFGSRLKRIRKSRCLTQEEISRLLNISRQAYSNYEQGRCVPSVITLIDMSIVLNCNLLFCFFTEEEKLRVKEFSYLQSEIPDFEKNALLSLYKSLDFNDRLSTVETMLIKACSIKYEEETKLE